MGIFLIFSYAAIAVWFLALKGGLTKEYREKCGGVLTEQSGSFYPINIRLNPIDFSSDSVLDIYKCLWIIKRHGGTMIKLELTNMNVVLYPYCQMARIEVEDDNRPLGVFCGTNNVTRVVTTETEHLYVLAAYDHHYEFGFNATYKVLDAPKQQCGGLVTNMSGWLSSLDTNKDGWYDTGLTCIWAIEGDRENVVIIHFLYLDISGREPCKTGDFIEIVGTGKNRLANEFPQSRFSAESISRKRACRAYNFDLLNPRFYIVKLGLTWIKGDYFDTRRFCGSVAPPAMVSVMNRLQVRFVTDYEEEAEGFNLTFYQETESSVLCGGYLNDTSGEINFSGFDGRTIGLDKEILDCLWILGSDEDKVIELQIQQIEASDCEETSLLVYDDHEHFGSFCGGNYSNSGLLIRSTSNILFIRLRFEGKTFDATFKASFIHVYDFNEECGGFLSGSDGKLTSPEGSADCFWVIKADPGMVVQIEITSLDLHKLELKPCYEYLLIYYSKSRKDKICGSFLTGLDPIRSSTDIAYVRYLSHGDGNHFRGTFHQEPELDRNCNGAVLFYENKTLLESLDNDGDDLYDYNLDCRWKIVDEPGKFIILEFLYFELEPSKNCRHDYLEVYVTGDEINRYCITLNQQIIKSNEINIHFVTDGSKNYRGFMILAKAIDENEAMCHHEMNVTSGWLTPPESYFTDLQHNDCSYRLRVQEGYVIGFRPFQLNLVWTSSCFNEFLKIDGTRKLCGNLTLPDFRSKHNIIIVQLRVAVIYGDISQKFNITFFQVEGQMNKVNIVLDSQKKGKGFIYFPEDVFPNPTGENIFNLDYKWTLIAEEDEVILYTTSTWLDEVDALEGGDRLEGTISVYRQSEGQGHYQFLSGHKYKVNIEWESKKKGKRFIYFPEDVFPNPTGENIFNLDYKWTLIAEEDEVILYTTSTWLDEVDDLEGGDRLEIYETHQSYKSCPMCTQIGSTETNVLTIVLVTDEWLGKLAVTEWLKAPEKYTTPVIQSRFEAAYEFFKDSPRCEPEYRCLGSNKTIPWYLLCDIHYDCNNQDDERFCKESCPENCTCIRKTVDCTGRKTCPYSQTYSELSDLRLASFLTLDTSNNPAVCNQVQRDIKNYRHLRELNMSGCNMPHLEHAFFTFLSDLLVLDLSYNAFWQLSSKSFIHLKELHTLRLDGNARLMRIESETFTGLVSLPNLKLSNLSIETIQGNAFAGLQLDTLEISHSTIRSVEQGAFGYITVTSIILNTSKILSFSDRIFENVGNVTYLYADSYKFCCIKPFYLPEENCSPQTPIFSNCYDLVGNSVLIGFLWIASIISLLCNFASVKYRFDSGKTMMKFGHRLLLFNLSLSDFMMSVFLLITVAADVSMRGRYAHEEDRWRSSAWCLLAGILSQCSITASAIFICLIALSRVLVIGYPTGAVRLTDRASTLLLLAVWTIALLSSSLPILYTTFIEKRAYSDAGIFLVLAFRHNRPSGYIWLVILLGCSIIAALALVAFGWRGIRREWAEMKEGVKRPRYMRAEDVQISRNILILVTIDTLCMLPVYILGITDSGQTIMDDETFAWVTLVVVALMSVINPFLYNFLALFDVMKLTPSEDEQNRPALVTEEEFDQVLEIINDHRYWWCTTRIRGYFSVKRLLRDGHLNGQMCIRIAHGLAKRLDGLHTRNSSQMGLRPSDVFVKRKLGRRNMRVALVCRAQFIKNPSECPANMEEFGNLIGALIQKRDDIQQSIRDNTNLRVLQTFF